MNLETQTKKPSSNRRAVDGRTMNPLAMRVRRGEVKEIHGRYHITVDIPLLKYYREGSISIDQRVIGERLYVDHCIAFMERSLLARVIEGAGSINGEEDKRTAADRFQKVMAAIGRISSWLARKVIIDGKMLRDVHDDFGWARDNTGMDRLRETLDEIIIAYDELDKYERKRREKRA